MKSEALPIWASVFTDKEAAEGTDQMIEKKGRTKGTKALGSRVVKLIDRVIEVRVQAKDQREEQLDRDDTRIQ